MTKEGEVGFQGGGWPGTRCAPWRGCVGRYQRRGANCVKAPCTRERERGEKNGEEEEGDIEKLEEKEGGMARMEKGERERKSVRVERERRRRRETEEIGKTVSMETRKEPLQLSARSRTFASSPIRIFLSHELILSLTRGIEWNSVASDVDWTFN